MDAEFGGIISRKGFLKAAAGAALVGLGGLSAGCEPTLSEKLLVEPGRARSDEPFVVRLTGLSAGERVVLSVAFDDAREKEWSATAVFEADGDGRVDISEQAPVEGSYGVKDSMGLIWSALGPGDGYLPPPEGLPVKVTAEVAGEEAKARVERYNLADGVQAEDVREDGLVGRFFSLDGQGPAPGVLVLGGSEGGLSPAIEREAALLASRGYATLVLAYFRGRFFEPEGAEDLPDTLTRVPLEYFGRAIEWLGEREEVRGDRLGVVGHSRGGELALLLGATYPELGATVSYVGSGAVASSPEGGEPAWTRDGEPVPYFLYTYQDTEVNPREVEQAEIPVEKIEGPVLLIAAGDDKLWPSERLSKVAMDRLERNAHSYDDGLVVYPDAGHAIQAPYMPTKTDVARFGGEAVANAEANEDSWRKVTELLDRSLKR